MNESKIKKYLMTIWLPILVFVIGTAILTGFVRHTSIEQEKQTHEISQLNAETYGGRIHSELLKGISVTETLEQILISEKGEINNFYTIAKNMMDDYIQSIQLAPEGIVDRIYPESGNEEGKINLMTDPDRKEYALYGKEHDEIVFQGPFNLLQGSKGLAIRNPVYLSSTEKSDESEYFWGFTIVIIKVPELFENSINALTNFGYNYRIGITSLISGDKDEITVCSSETVPDSWEEYSFDDIGCSKWTLEVKPSAGWTNGKKSSIMFTIGITMVILFTALVFFILVLGQRHNKYKNLATVDYLTGLYNRAGFTENLKKYLDDHPQESCVQAVLDIDDFKIVNDLYGHATGDSTLQSLAHELGSAFPKNAIISRSGGDEFNIVLKNTDNKAATEILTKFVNAERAFWHNGERTKFTISMGFAEYPSQAKNAAELSSKSDVALYEAKLHGKHNCYAYDKNFHMESRNKLGFVLNDISRNLPGAFLIYKADPEDDTMLYANDEMIKLSGCSDLDDFMAFCDRKFGNLIRPDEKTEVEKSIWEQISSESDGTNDYVQFHFALKNGTYRHVFDHGRIVDSPNYGKVFYVLIIDSEFIATHYIG